MATTKYTPSLALGQKARNESYMVYIIDDSIIDRTYLKRLLVKQGFEICGEAENGEVAVQKLQKLKKLQPAPDIIFVDQEMPYMSGTETILRLKKLCPISKIVMASAHSSKGLIKKILELKIHSYILKPVQEEFLFNKMANLVNRKDLIQGGSGLKRLKLDLDQVKIPALPRVINEVISFDVNDPDKGIQDFEKILLPDLGITSNLLKLANSAYYGRARKVETLKEAITLIGVKSVKNIILMDFTKKLSRGTKNPLMHTYLREHPILSSLVAFDLAKPLGIEQVQESIFLIVLLKKIGMSILAMNFPANYLKILKLHEFNLKTIFDLEQDEFQVTSIELGEKVFRAWNFSEHYIDAVVQQNFTISHVEKVSDINRLSRLSDIIAAEMLQIAVSNVDIELKNALFQHYAVPEETAELFGEDYYEMIKDHPFLNLSH